MLQLHALSNIYCSVALEQHETFTYSLKRNIDIIDMNKDVREKCECIIGDIFPLHTASLLGGTLNSARRGRSQISYTC